MPSKALGNVFKLRDIINVKDPAFGAKGTGAGTDAVSIQAAVSALTAGGEVYIPPGTYPLGGTKILSSSDNITLRGAGRGASTLTYSGNSIAVHFGNSAPTTNLAQNCNVRDLTIDGTGSSTANAVGLLFDRPVFCGVMNAEVKNFTTGTGIKMDGSGNYGACNTIFDTLVTNTLVCVRMESSGIGTEYINATNIIGGILDSGSLPGSIGLSINRGAGIASWAVTYENNTTAVDITSASDTKIIGNYMEGQTTGTIIRAGSNRTYVGLNNYFAVTTVLTDSGGDTFWFDITGLGTNAWKLPRSLEFLSGKYIAFGAAGATEGGGVAIPLTNRSAGAMAAGDVVMVDAVFGDSCNTTGTANDDVPGVVVLGGAAGAVVLVGIKGKFTVSCDATAVNLKDTIVTSATAGQGTVNNAQTNPKKILGYACSAKGAGVGSARVIVG